MSRIGRMPIPVPAGVDVKVEAGNVISVQGTERDAYKNPASGHGSAGGIRRHSYQETVG